jgi:ATP-dependent RNA helicase DeaD
MKKPVHIRGESGPMNVDHIEQYWIFVPQRRKLEALVRVLQMEPDGSTLIFARTKKGCAEVSDALRKRGIAADAIHGDLNQDARERVIHRLRSRALSVMVATDVAARGLDVSHLTRVINVDFPGGSETYVHRIGRTGRAGAKGIAITMVTPAEKRKLHFLQKDIRHDIQEMYPPTVQQLAQAQQDVLWKRLEAVREESDLTEVKEWLAERRAESGVQPKDIAAAAIQILLQQKGIQLNPPPEPPRREQRRPEQRRPEPRQTGRREFQDAPRGSGDLERINEAQIFMDIGKTSGVRPQDIVGAIANEGGIPGTEIGRISLLDMKTFVGLPRNIAERIVGDFPTMLIRGQEVHLSMAKSSPGRPPHRGGPGKPGGFKKPGGYKTKGSYNKPDSRFTKKKGGGSYPTRHKKK